MITFNTLGVHGQLGNQMFQYAVLQGISAKNNAEVVFSNETKSKSYLFDIFNLSNYSIRETDLLIEYREPKFSFNQEVFSLDNVSLFGYFQSEKYFKHCSGTIKKEFTFKGKTLDLAENILTPYRDKELISVHIRRGDYLANPDFHPIPSVDYYNNAMDYLDSPDSLFVCVSNDIDWCKEYIKRDNLIYQFNALEVDMCLISKCHHHILANSSFSWWGSWLGDYKGKKCIAPTPWFGPRASEYDTRDLYRKDFIVL